MPLAIADLMADGQILCVAVAALTQGLNVLQRRRLGRHVFAADPARHDAVELPRHGFVHLVPGMAQPAHGDIFMQGRTRDSGRRLACAMLIDVALFKPGRP